MKIYYNEEKGLVFDRECPEVQATVDEIVTRYPEANRSINPWFEPTEEYELLLDINTLEYPMVVDVHCSVTADLEEIAEHVKAHIEAIGEHILSLEESAYVYEVSETDWAKILEYYRELENGPARMVINY